MLLASNVPKTQRLGITRSDHPAIPGPTVGRPMRKKFHHIGNHPLYSADVGQTAVVRILQRNLLFALKNKTRTHQIHIYCVCRYNLYIVHFDLVHFDFLINLHFVLQLLRFSARF